MRNEDFSPILIGKHSNEDGRVSFAPVELSADQLHVVEPYVSRADEFEFHFERRNRLAGQIVYRENVLTPRGLEFLSC